MSKNSTYTPTFMEKFLRKQYKWWYLMNYGIKSNSAYIIPDILWYLSRIIIVLSMLYLYFVTGQTNILTIVLVTNFFATTQGITSVYAINESIFDGSITKLLIVPTNIFSSLFFVRLGVAIRGIIFNFLMFIIAMFFAGVDIQPFRLLIILIPYFFISILIKFFLDSIVGSLAFWMTSAHGAITLYLNTLSVLNGTIIPLTYFPALVVVLPTSFTSYHFAQIYLGNYDFLRIFLTIFGSIVWCLLLYFVMVFLFKMGFKKNEATGL